MKYFIAILIQITYLSVQISYGQNTCITANPIIQACLIPSELSLTLSYDTSNCGEFGNFPPGTISDIWFTLSLSESATYAFSSSSQISSAVAEIFTGTCNNLNYLACSDFPVDTNEIILPPGLITIRVIYLNILGANLCINPVSDGGCSSPILIDPPQDVSACEQYTLPPITGINLTGNQAYYTDNGGTGTMYDPGEIIDISSVLFAYDSDGICSAEESFEISIENGGSLFQSGIGLGLESSWFSNLNWGVFVDPPTVCDNVIIRSGTHTIVDAQPESAVCRTLEVELGADFEVQLTGVLIVGN